MLNSQTPLARRTCLARLGLGAVGFYGTSQALAAADPNSQADLLSRGLQTNGIEVTLPPLADNSNAIPLQFTLQATPGQQLVGLEIIAPENPNRVTGGDMLVSTTFHVFVSRLSIYTQLVTRDSSS